MLKRVDKYGERERERHGRGGRLNGQIDPN
jgi:hypothetical protein